MPPKTVNMMLLDMLDDLGDDNFKRFCHQLRQHGTEPRVRRNKVEGKSRLEISDVLVSHFTEAGALRVAAEILRVIGCKGEAEALDKMGGQSSTPGPTAPSSAGPPAVADNGCTGEQFVDKHRAELIKRVGNIDPIMDELLKEGVISDEIYANIRAKPTRQQKMRELYDNALNAKERKETFYEILERNERHLIAELKKM